MMRRLRAQTEVRQRRAMSCYPQMETTTALSRFPFREITTMTQDKKRARDIPNNQFVVANRTGSSRFHTTWSVNDKGDRVWLAFDPSRPCRMFNTTETSGIIVGRYQESGQDRSFLAAAWESEIKSATVCSENEVSSVTGLHFIYPGLLIFYVEGTEENINDFIRLLNNLTAKEGFGLTKVKVVHIIHNIKTQILNCWHWKVIDPPLRTERSEAEENKCKIVSMILHIVLNLSKQPPLAVKKTLENLQEKMIRFIPDAAMLESILRDTSLMDPYQYIQHVLNMRGVTLDTETVWPVPSTIF